jgi:hypothetical protein
MRHKLANLWVKSIAAASQNAEYDKYFEKFAPRLQTLIAIYFGRVYLPFIKETTEIRSDFWQYPFRSLPENDQFTNQLAVILDTLEFSVETKTWQPLNTNFADVDRTRRYIRTTGWIPDCYSDIIHIARTFVKNFNLTPISELTFAVLENFIEFFIYSGNKLTWNKAARAERQQNRLLSLFLPIDNWQMKWHTNNTTQLAATIYGQKSWSDCPILADALLDAGCDDDYIQWLLRTQWELFGRGVWIIDQLAGKNTIQ